MFDQDKKDGVQQNSCLLLHLQGGHSACLAGLMQGQSQSQLRRGALRQFWFFEGAQSMRRIAVVGSGISGLTAAYRLSDFANVTLFEAGDYFGGHAHTVDVTLQDITYGVDTGFLVLNEATYPELLALFAELEVELAPSEMSFSVQAQGLEWSGSNLNGVFAQRSNFFRPRFWYMLADILRFNRLATHLALQDQSGDTALGVSAQTVKHFLDEHRFSQTFREGYLLPMLGSIWSCPLAQMLEFPLLTLLRFCHNHGLLQVQDRPQWFTVKGGSQNYVKKMLKRIPDARLNTPVRSIRRLHDSDQEPCVQISTDFRTERFDEVVLACHTNQALLMLQDASEDERAVLSGIGYQHNRAVLHTDTHLLPKRKRAWAAWNYESAASAEHEENAVCLHYLINRLQPLPFSAPVIVSLNPVREPHKARVIAQFDYEHPVFDAAAIAAQARLPSIQGHMHTWFCGAWTRYGFHEDGVISAQTVSNALRERWYLPLKDAA
jgi:uncharacterized protein